MSSLLEQIKTELTEQSLTNQYQTGRVQSYSDGVVIIVGLPKTSYLQEVIINGNKAVVLELNIDSCKALLLSQSTVKAGDLVISYGNTLVLNINPDQRGVVYDALGQILLGSRVQQATVKLKLEDNAPLLMDREPVTRPLVTGIIAVDTLCNIGKGQRQLIIGDRQTGKTSIALDAILNQKGRNTVCIYVSIGQKQASVSKIHQLFKDKGVDDYTMIFNAPASSSVAMQYLVPFSAVSLGQFLMNQGQDVLIVYDDLSKHAVAWRQISLLLKRPVGREAFPGDVFYLHSRLLERGGQLIHSLKGGSLTALPIIETLANDVTGYIPTNVISITDGQIYLEASLFNKGIRPAISAGLSVSRVGGAALSKPIKKNGSKIKLELSQYRELLSFSQIGSGLDSKTKQTLDHGDILTKVLVQDNNKPLSVLQMVARLRVVNLAKINQVPKAKFLEFIHKLDQEVETGILEQVASQVNNSDWLDDTGVFIDEQLTNFLNYELKSIEK
jgi:F-type H+/Na+-transporting ATPase subunit alpha